LRAFRAAEQYAFGKRGRPRFKSLNRLNSIEGKADAVIRYLTATLIISAAPLRSCGKPVRGLTCTRSTSPWPRVEVHFGLCGRHLLGQVLCRMFFNPEERLELISIDQPLTDGEILPMAGGIEVIHTRWALRGTGCAAVASRTNAARGRCGHEPHGPR
jgi:hypothetical protein